MLGKTGFPDSLPSPPCIPEDSSTLLGPLDFAKSSDCINLANSSSSSSGSQNNSNLFSTHNSNHVSKNIKIPNATYSNNKNSNLSDFSPGSSVTNQTDTDRESRCNMLQNIFPNVEFLDGKEVVTVSSVRNTQNMELERNNMENSHENNSSNLLTPECFSSPCSKSVPIPSLDSKPVISLNQSATGLVHSKFSLFRMASYQSSEADSDFEPVTTGFGKSSFRRGFERKSSYNSMSEDMQNSEYDDDYEEELASLEQLEQEDTERNVKEINTDKETCVSGRLPPIGVFWDIENCQVPKGLSATHVVQAVRSRFFEGRREAEFMCVCDTLKENSTILEELNDAQVNIVHVGSTVKNAADDKLLQSMRRFADIHGHIATIVLISGDTNFSTELYDLRYRKNLHVILVHNAHAQDSLKLCAHETALFTEVTEQLPPRVIKTKMSSLRRDIIVHNLPEGIEEGAIRRRLHMLSSNCGGRVIRIRPNSAVLLFQTTELAARAKKRIDGEDVFGNKVYCTFGRTSDKESAQRFDSNNKVFQHIQGQNRERPDAFCGGGYTQNMTTDSSSADISWRSSISDNSFQSYQYQPFKSYNKIPSSPLSDHQLGPGSRTWRNGTNWKPQIPVSNQMNGSMVGRLEGSPQNEELAQEQTSAQPLYLDKTPESFKKGRSQRVQFRMSSPPSFSFHNASKSSDIYGQDHSFRGRSPSPLLWSPIKGTWSPPPAELQQGQVLYGLRELNIAETSQDGSVLSTQQIPVELQVTNLDQNIDAREMKRILFTIFRDHVMVLHVSVFVQSDGNLAASLRVPSQQDAQYAISQLHRKKIGAKRIIISYVNHNQPSPELKRSKVIALLQEVPGKKLPLFKFRELYERRFHETIGVSEMYNMRDIVTVSDNSTGRMVALHPEFRHLNSPSLADTSQSDVSESCGSRYCKLHSSGPDESIGWAERDDSTSIPNVEIGLRVLAASIHALLESHSGSLPLASLMDCYHADIGPLEEEESGVPLEHLISCLPGVCIIVAPGGFKYIHWLENKVVDEAEELARSVSPPLVGQLALFSRELVDLLKTFPHCRLPFARFIPAYHHHFGRQCRVADYGFTKLADLFDALPHVVQVLGEGNKRILTLAHKAQTKRFSSDLLRVLKGQPTKAISLEAFPSAYEKALGRPWNVVDYGVCDVEDLLIEVGETIVIVTRSSNETMIAIPKREQTPEEIEKTRQFAAEVVELLRHSPQCKMQFNRFIPAYHHHFGKQCRVADYGFSKLIELFEAIPDVLIQVFDDEDDGEKQLQLVERERIKVLGDQVATVVRGAPRQAIRVSALSQVFTRYYGYSLRPHQYGANTLEEVIGKLRNHVKLQESGTEEAVVTLVDRGYVHEVLVRARRLLWEDAKCCLSLTEFIQEYTNRFHHPPNLEIIKKDLEDVLIVEGDEDEGTIRLVPLQMCARDLLTLLHEAGGRMLLLNFDTAYLDRFGVACRPAAYGFPNLVALVQSLGDLVAVRGRGAKRILVLNRENAPSPPAYQVPTPQRNNCENAGMYNNYNDGGYDSKPPPPSHLPQPHKVNPTPPMDYQRYIHTQEPNSSSPMLVGIHKSTPHPAYHSSPPMVYPGSPAPSPGSVMWGQMWSPQYPVMPPLSPAHYMVPTNLLSWGSVAASPPAMQCSSSPPTPNVAANIANVGPTPISIHTLDELTKQAVGRANEEYMNSTQHEDYTSAPPNACDLPSPEMLTQACTPVSIVMPVNTPSTCPAPQHQSLGSGDHDDGVSDTWSSGNSDVDKGDGTPTPTNAPKCRTKRRLAAQFITN